MANRIIEQLNVIKNNAPFVGSFYSKSYIQDGVQNLGQPSIQKASESAINMYFRVGGYDLYDCQEKNFVKVTDLVGQITSSLAAVGQPFSFTLHGQGNGIEVFYGTHYENAGIIRNAFRKNLQNAVIDNIWIRQEELMRLQQYNSVIVGPKALSVGTIDTVISSLSGTDYLINFLCIPCSTQEITNELRQMNSVLSDLQRVTDFEWSFGSGRQRRYPSENRDVADVVQIVDREKTRLNTALAAGAWKVLIHVGAETVSNLKRVSASLVAAFASSRLIEENNTIGTTTVEFSTPVISKSIWEYPVSFLGSFDLGGLYSNSLMNIMDADCLRSVVALPTQTHGAYNIRHMGASAEGIGVFSSQPPIPQGNIILTLGMMSDGSKYNFSLDDFRQHAFVTGAPRYGKSTSIQKIITEAYQRGIPFVVVESAKKEYWELKQVVGLERIRVYSSGRDTLPLQINPFQPEYNTQLEYHIQSLIHALLSMFDQGDPLPQILTELVYKCYEARGWDVEERVRDDPDLEYPNFDDMLAHLDEVIESIGYDPEIKDRMRGVVKIRIQSLIRQAGKSLNTKNNISAEELFKTSAIIELDDFADQLKPFVASVIALKVNEYTRQCKMAGNLKRLMILEEAHHILPNPELRSASSNAAKCAAYFSNMLAEVSAYGTGIVVVDQRASAIAPSAIANTSIKIIHNIHEGSDIDTVMRCLNLRDQAKPHLSILNIGQAVVAFPQTDRICMVDIDGHKEKNADAHTGCLFCTRRCCDAVEFDISQYEINLLTASGISRTFLQRCVNSIVDRTARQFTPEDIMCLAGRLCQCVSSEDDNPIIIRQHLYDLFVANK